MLLTQISHDSSLRSHWNIIHQVSLRTGLCHKSNRYICKAPQLTITVPRLKKSKRCDALSRHHVTCNSSKGHNFTNYVLNARDSSYKLNIFTSIVSALTGQNFLSRYVQSTNGRALPFSWRQVKMTGRGGKLYDIHHHEELTQQQQQQYRGVTILYLSYFNNVELRVVSVVKMGIAPLDSFTKSWQITYRIVLLVLSGGGTEKSDTCRKLNVRFERD